MRTIIANFLKRLTEILELFIALMLAAGIILLCVRIRKLLLTFRLKDFRES